MSGPTGFSGDQNPFQSPLASSGPSPFSPSGGIRSGPPWEQAEKPLVGRYVETVVLAYTNTMVLFSDMRREGGFGAPLLYAVIGGMIGGIIGAIPQMILSAVMAGANGNQANLGLATSMSMSIGTTVAMLVFLPFFLVIGMFLSAALYHVALMVLGGANFPYEATFRAIAYASGSAALLQAIPFCGQYINGIVSLVFMIIGIMKVQETSGLKATVAVLLPVAICCAVIFTTVVAVIGVGVAASAGP